MAFNWTEYLRVAKDIHTQSKISRDKDEALLRTAVSRAYYSVINFAAENANKKHNQLFSKTNFHTEVIGFYRHDLRNPNYQEAGRLLRILNGSRQKCDYEALIDGNVEKMLESSIIQAENIKSELAKS
ncbi:MAG: hypothetical protein ACYC1K_00260 [Minisyncoccota bacterium]